MQHTTGYSTMTDHASALAVSSRLETSSPYIMHMVNGWGGGQQKHYIILSNTLDGTIFHAMATIFHPHAVCRLIVTLQYCMVDSVQKYETHSIFNCKRHTVFAFVAVKNAPVFAARTVTLFLVSRRLKIDVIFKLKTWVFSSLWNFQWLKMMKNFKNNFAICMHMWDCKQKFLVWCWSIELACPKRATKHTAFVQVNSSRRI